MGLIGGTAEEMLKIIEDGNGRKPSAVSAGSPSTVTDEMLTAAMRKAVEIGMLPKLVNEETYLKNWQGMKTVIEAAMLAK